MIVYDLEDAAYHSRPELSSTGARLLLPEYKGSPATYKYWQGRERNTAAYDLGKAVHARILGVGARAVAYPDDVLASNGAASTKAAKEWAEAARADGLIPMKAADLQPIEEMAEAVLTHELAGAILEKAPGREVSIFSEVDGVPVRARFDIYSDNAGADLKTAADASPDGFTRAVRQYGLHFQEAWYRDVRRAETGADLDAFKFIVVEKEPPHLVAVYDLDIVFRDIGREQATTARNLWRECTTTGVWPGYQSQTLSCPTYLMFDHETRYSEEIHV